MGDHSTNDDGETSIPAVRVLDDAECWRLLEAASLGRLAVRRDAAIDVFPVNFLVHDKGIYFRSAPGSKLIDLTRFPDVAFEIDGQHARHLWSVVVHGRAARLGSDAEIEASHINTLAGWHPGEKFNYVRIEPETVSGRSFAKAN
jgi:nitroimidazol reductase NimA-like FMN-containing flavoprotein (pyridoxamine 5'-phosphate oxidase superfamily)